jgi:dynein heavy chain
MLAMKLMELNNELDAAEVKFFLTGGVSLGESLPDNPAPWISDKCWGEMNRLDKLPNFKGWIEHFTKDFELYKEMYDSSSP